MDKSNGLLTYGISDQKLNEGRTKGEKGDQGIEGKYDIGEKKLVTLTDRTDPGDSVTKPQLNKTEIDFLKLDGNNEISDDLKWRYISRWDGYGHKKIITNVNDPEHDLDSVNFLSLRK